jgi:hypothetical protein
MHIGMTDAAGIHADQDFAGAGLGSGDVGDFDIAAEGAEESSFHLS